MVFNPSRDIPDLSGKVILVTGGNIGLGKESILQFAKHNPRHILLGARNKSKATKAIAEIKNAVPGANISFLPIDLSSFASIKNAADAFNQQCDRLDILLNNAGLLGMHPGLTEDGYEIQFGTNHMGTALLTKLLLPVLEKTASLPGSDVRIVNLSSAIYKYAPEPGILFSQNKTTLSDISDTARYGQSKLANVYFTQSLALRHPSIKCVALHPGVVTTGIWNNWQANHPYLYLVVKPWLWFISTDVATGALTQLWASTAPSDKVKSGGFYFPVGEECADDPVVKNSELAEQLWEWTETELKQHGF